MKKLLTFLLLPVIVFGAAGDIKIDRKNSTDTAWISTIFSKTNSGFLGLDSSGVPTMVTGLTWSPTAITLASTATGGLQIYNTADQTTNYERLEIVWSASSLYFRNVKGGGGALRELIFGVNNVQIKLPGGTGAVLFQGYSGGSAGSVFSFTNAASAAQATSGNQSFVSLAYTINQSSGSASNTGIKLAATETALGSGEQSFLDFYGGSAGTTKQFTLLNTGKVSTYAGVSTAGEGVADIRAQANITAQSSNATITSYANPAADGDYEVSGQMSVTASTALTTTLTVTYTDVANVVRTMILPIVSVSGTYVAAGAITGAGASIWESPVMHIRVKASTTITILTSAGTFTGVTYSASGVIKKMS